MDITRSKTLAGLTNQSIADDLLLVALLTTPQDDAARSLAARYAPILRFDAHEPFLPLAAGYTIFRESGPSPSFQRGHKIELAPAEKPAAALAIEYAIWWDWDIGHLYELEHVWVYVDATGRVVRTEASWHGGQHDMSLDGRLALDGDHVLLFSEPGKHAFAPTPDWFRARRAEFKRSETRTLAGVGGVLIAPYIAGRCAGRRWPIAWRTPIWLAAASSQPGISRSSFASGRSCWSPGPICARGCPAG